jgi:predicted TIM-barrel fold metal-dependent hydrolase
VKYNIISGDSHLELLADRWTHRIDPKYRDRAPKNVVLPDGADGTVIENLPPVQNPMDLYGGKGRDIWHPFGQRYDDTPGTGSPEQRMAEQDQDHVDAEVLYPAVVAGPRLWSKVKDPKATAAIFRGYNDWLAEEYCSVAPDRLIGVGALPSTGVDDAIAEIQHCKQIGIKSGQLIRFPNGGPRPTSEDDKFWAAAIEMDFPISIHVELDRSMEPNARLLDYPKEHEVLNRTELAFQVQRFARAGGVNTVQLVLSGLFDRFPTLQIFMAENCIGWVPFFLEMADVRYSRHIHWSEQYVDYKPLKQLPSEYIKQHFLWGFQVDRSGVELRHHMGVDNLIWAVDFPHQESDWPDSSLILEHNFHDIPKDEVYKMVAGNAMRFFHLDA